MNWCPSDDTGGSMSRTYFEQPNNADWNQQLQLNSYNASTNMRVPYDLTDVEVKMEFVGSSSGDPSLLLTTNNGYLIIPIDGASSGQVFIYVPASVMWTLPAGLYVGDCLLFIPGGPVVKAFSARLSISPGVTPPTP